MVSIKLFISFHKCVKFVLFQNGGVFEIFYYSVVQAHLSSYFNTFLKSLILTIENG